MSSKQTKRTMSSIIPCVARGEKHQVAMGEDHQVAMTSLTSAAWPVLQRWVEECHEAAREKATRHIQSWLRSQMLKKWASAADVIPPGLVSSSSDDDGVNHYLSSGSEEESTSNSEDFEADVLRLKLSLKCICVQTTLVVDTQHDLS